MVGKLTSFDRRVALQVKVHMRRTGDALVNDEPCPTITGLLIRDAESQLDRQDESRL